MIKTMTASAGLCKSTQRLPSEGARSRGDPHNPTLRQQAHAHVHRLQNLRAQIWLQLIPCRATHCSGGEQLPKFTSHPPPTGTPTLI